MRLALVVEYEGTAYHGFQYQVNARSIQEEIEEASRSGSPAEPPVYGTLLLDAQAGQTQADYRTVILLFRDGSRTALSYEARPRV